MKQIKKDTTEDKPPTVLMRNGIYPFYPYWIKETPPSPLKNYYSKNGHLKLIKSLNLEIVTDVDYAEKLWNEFSPHTTLFDTWEFRLAFLKGYNRAPHFMLLKNDRENLALLPLWYEADNKRYAWFGSTWQEENTFFSKNHLLIPPLLSIAPTPLHLNAISDNAIPTADGSITFETDDPKFILDLTTLSKAEDFLLSLKKKRRYNLRRDHRHIMSQNPEIVFDDFSYFDKMVELNKTRFAQKGEDTDWEDPRRIETFRYIIERGKKAKSYHTRMIIVKIRGEVAAIDLIALYKDCYYPIKCAYDIANFPGVGNFVNLFEIEDALKLQMKKMDFLEIDYGWKNKWFQSVPLFKYNKDYIEEENN